MGRTCRKDILTTPPRTLNNTSLYGYEYIDIGNSLTATVTVIAVTGQGWVDWVAMQNRFSGAAVEASTRTDVMIDIDDQRVTSTYATTTYGWQGVYGHISTDLTNIVFGAPVPFRSNFRVQVKSGSQEQTSYSLAFAIKYGVL